MKLLLWNSLQEHMSYLAKSRWPVSVCMTSIPREPFKSIGSICSLIALAVLWCHTPTVLSEKRTASEFRRLSAWGRELNESFKLIRQPIHWFDKAFEQNWPKRMNHSWMDIIPQKKSWRHVWNKFKHFLLVMYKDKVTRGASPTITKCARSRERKGYANSRFDRGVGLRGNGSYLLKPSISASFWPAVAAHQASEVKAQSCYLGKRRLKKSIE